MTVRLGERLLTGALAGMNPDQLSYCALWRHVLATQLTDACSKKPSTKKQVYEWLQSRDFEMTCDFACVSQDWARATINRILAETHPILAKHLMSRTRDALLARPRF